MTSDPSLTAAELQGIDSQSITTTIESLLKSGAIKAHKDGNHGSLYPRVEEFGSQGVPFLTAKLLCDGKIDIDGAPRLADDKADKLRLGFVQPGDVLLSHNATIGRVAIVPQFSGRLLIGTSLTYFRLDESKILPRYLAAYFSSSDFQNQLKAVMSHTTRNQVPITAQRSLRVVIPPMAAQKPIATTLSTFDDRIALLRETNATLEAIAQTLFKSWFVDFDPVRAKAEGRDPDGLDAETAGLFPDSFEDVEFGSIPTGWRAGVLGDLAQTAREQRQPLDLDDKTHYVGLEHIPRRSLGLTDWGNAGALESAKSCFKEGDILFGKLRPYFHKVVVAPFDGVCSTDVLVCRPKEPAFYGLVAMHLSSKPLVDYADRLSNGAKMPRVNWKDLAAYPMVVPPEPIADYFRITTEPLIQSIVANVHKAKTLADLRDALLPRLISGQLRLNEVESLLQDAA